MDDSYQADIISLRSTASSIISTGTKTSIGTLAQPYFSQSQEGPSSSGIDVHLGGQRNFRITARPGSILSISSFDAPAPPYESYASTNASVATLAPSTPRQESSRTPSPPPHINTDTETTAYNYTYSSASSTPHALTAFPPPRPTSASPPLHSPAASRTPSPPPSPTLPDPTTLSQHYTLVVRTIDANHRAELARMATAHAAALAQTRHDIDAAYRSVLRARNQDVERIREEAAAAVAAITARCEETLVVKEKEYEAEVERLRMEMERREGEWEGRIARARNEVEDLWEGRWKDRMRVSGEEMERAVGRARGEVGEGWMRVLGERWPERRGEWEEVRREVGEEGWVGGERGTVKGAQTVAGRKGMWEALRGEEWEGVYDGSKVVKEREGKWEEVWEGRKMVKGRKGRWEIRKEKEKEKAEIGKEKERAKGGDNKDGDIEGVKNGGEDGKGWRWVG
ncbi:hypothetical protein MMC30_007360 [Trapelia coarctata]|nr:hypothetical protein [Trapelia coarctata]